MANLAKQLINFEVLHDDKIEKVLIGKHYNDYWDDDEEDRRPIEARNELVDRETALKILDLDYDSGYGGADCFPLYAWSKKAIFFVSEYDGATGLARIPRNPQVMEVEFI